MQAEELRTLLKSQPFEPIALSLSDGRMITIRHPDQAAVSMRKLFVGLAKIKRPRRLATPSDGESVAKDWILVDLTHIVSAEPENGHHGKKRRHSK